MANISTAHGDICITAASEFNVKQVFRNMIDSEEAEEYDYGIVTSETEDSLYITRNEDGTFSTYFGFEADGRWSFESTLERSYAKRAAYVIGQRDKELLDKLEQQDFKIEFNYTDYEPGLQFIVQQKTSLNHAAGTPLGKSSFKVLETIDIEYNFENLLETTGMTTDELIEYVGGKENAQSLGYPPDSAVPEKEYNFYAENYSSNLPIFDYEGHEMDWPTFRENLKGKLNLYRTRREFTEIACIPVAESCFADIYLDEFEKKVCLEIRSIDGLETFAKKVYPGMDYEAELLNWSTCINRHDVLLKEFPPTTNGFIEKLGEELGIACKEAMLGNAGVKETFVNLPIEVALKNAIREVMNKEEYKDCLSKTNTRALMGICEEAIQDKFNSKELAPKKQKENATAR